MRVAISQQKSARRSKLVPNEWLRLCRPFVRNSFKASAWCMWKCEPDRRTMGDNDLPHRTSIASQSSRGARKFVNCCSASPHFTWFLIVSINDARRLSRHEKKLSVKTIKNWFFYRSMLNELFDLFYITNRGWFTPMCTQLEVNLGMNWLHDDMRLSRRA